MNFSTDQLKKFIIESNKAGWASSGESGNTRETDGSKSFRFSLGDFSSHDNYFGGEPYGGRAVVFYRGKPVWMMVYYGEVLPDVDFEQAYSVLRKALMNMPQDHPFRGPNQFSEGVSH